MADPAERRETMIEVVIAARGGNVAKSRMRPALGPACERLVEEMLLDMLHALRDAPSIANVILVTPGGRIAALAACCGAACILDPGDGLDAACALARRAIARRDPSAAVLFLPGDLPLLDPDEVEQVAARHAPGVAVLVPSASDDGTAALLFEARRAFRFSYGAGSFHRHMRSIDRLGLAARLVPAPSLARDIDRPEDLAALAGGGGVRTRALLRELQHSRSAG
jgi:2-phospho-L-lactate guanylyltransferase